MGAQSIPSGTADLLVITFNALGQIIMQNKSDIGFIDSHSKGDGRHNDLNIFADKVFLVPPALDIREPGMIGFYGKACFGQGFCEIIHLFSSQAVNDPRLIGELFDEFGGLQDRICFWRNLEEKIYSVEAGNKGVAGFKIETDLNILLNPRGSRCGQGYTNGLGELLSNFNELTVLRPEIMPPFRDAVSFIDGDAVHAPGGEYGKGFWHQECFRSKIENSDIVSEDAGDILPVFFR